MSVYWNGSRAGGVEGFLARPSRLTRARRHAGGDLRRRPVFCVVQINNVFSNPAEGGRTVQVAFPRPQAVFQYYDGLSGELLYAEAIPTR